MPSCTTSPASRRSRRDEVAQPHLGGIHPELAGEVVHDPLVRVGGLGAARAAVGVGGREVGEHALALEGVGAEVVEPAVGERPEDGDAGGEQLQVGTHVREQLDPHPEDLALARGGDRDLLDLAAPVGGGDVVLRPRLGPLHRLAETPRQRERERLLGVDVELGAEAAADVRGDDADLAVGDAADQGEQVAHEVGHLRGRVDGERAAHRLRDDHDRSGLHRRGQHALLQVPPLDHHVGLREGPLDVADGQWPGVAVVGAQLLVHQWGARFEGGLDVHDRRQLLVVDLYEPERLVGRARVGRQHDGNSVADVVDLAPRQRRVVGDLDVLRDRPPARQADRELARQVLAGEDGHDAGPRAGGARVDTPDPGVRERAPDDRHVERAGRGDVVGPRGSAGDQCGVLAAGHAPADEGRGLGGLRHLARLLARRTPQSVLDHVPREGAPA
jgi:hypothetical protein